MTDTIDASRRRFFTASIKSVDPTTLRLPWSKGEDSFTSQCTQCQKCIEVCETNIISRDRQGFPVIDFSKDECTFCQACVQACDEPLFSDPDKTPAWKAEVKILDKCLTKYQIYCQSCRDVCDQRAIEFPMVLNQVPQPKVNQVDCNSCGACVSTCPQDAIELSLISRDQL